MFETAELGRKVSKKKFDDQVPELRTELLRVQDELKSAPFPVITVVAGVDGAGKGETVNLLHEWTDARYLETHGFGPMTDEERDRPDFWRFWRALPPRGRIGIFFGSWYTDPIIRRVYKQSRNPELDAALVRLTAFEKALSDDGALIVKLWLHLSKEAQHRRLTTLEASASTRWRVTKLDWKHFELYDRFRKTSERALRVTSTGEAPWTVIEGTDERYRSLTVGKHLLRKMREHIASIERGASARAPRRRRAAKPKPVLTILDTVDLSRKLEYRDYVKAREKYQGRLNRHYRRAKKRQISTILVLEGWDAAGKGGAIRRVTPALDARDYKVIPIGAPSDEEKAHHYLWRFWRHLPQSGRVTIFDRSWYGRVLVERVEGFATREEWMRAYAEINEFEEQLSEHGVVLLKFWMHIDPDEQLRRFKERERKSFKQYKITDEDFRNRDQWLEYELAANEMVERTSTEYAPWTLIAGNDKRYARIEVLKTVCDALQEKLRSLKRE